MGEIATHWSVLASVPGTIKHERGETRFSEGQDDTKTILITSAEELISLVYHDCVHLFITTFIMYSRSYRDGIVMTKICFPVDGPYSPLSCLIGITSLIVTSHESTWLVIPRTFIVPDTDAKHTPVCRNLAHCLCRFSYCEDVYCATSSNNVLAQAAAESATSYQCIILVNSLLLSGQLRL
ncbi:hypothetical protein J6590_007425 [Homalodisca vitripennis]|nr:hypothetical protein J6590_007425 [Homalodisca vitripennis]